MVFIHLNKDSERNIKMYNQNNPSVKRKKVSTRILVTLFVIFGVATLVLGVFSYVTFTLEYTRALTARSSGIADGFVGAIDVDRLYTSMNAPSEDDYWQLMQAGLSSVKENMPRIVAMYIVRVQGNELIHYASGSRANEATPGLLPFGAVVPRTNTDSDNVARQVAISGETDRVWTHNNGEFGRVLSGVSPIFDRNGNVVALVILHFETGVIVDTAWGVVRVVLLAAVVFFFGFSFFMRWRIYRIVDKALLRLVNIEHGDLSFIAREYDKTTSEDNFEKMYGHFSHLYSTFKMLFDDIKQMSFAHTNGDYNSKLDESKYIGGHKELVNAINEMTFMYVKDYLALIDVVEHYGKGNFDATLPPAKEKWQWVNHRMDNLRDSFVRVTGEINKLTKEATAGRFDVLANRWDLEGEWAQMIEGLNTLVMSMGEPLQKIQGNITLMAEGKFVPLEGEFNGQFDVIKQAYNLNCANTIKIIDEISNTLGAISRGDLTTSIHQVYPGSYAPIREALTVILDSLNKYMQEISTTADLVLEGSNGLTQSAEMLTYGTASQAQTIQKLVEVVGSINDIAIANATKAAEASSLAQQSNKNAQKGNQEMQNLLISMEDIKASSAAISQIIKVIESIAFQTNLLALNASVEAARAGEHGKGFAVVANEVRSLASRSSDAAKETAGLIETSITSVDGGNVAVEITANSLNTIVGTASTVSGIISKIVDISNQQTETVQEILSDISQISNVVQDNISTSEECSAMANEFNAQAKSLKELVSFYQLKS